MLVLSKLADVWRSTFGISITFRHLFSIESVPWKRHWIMKHFRPEFLFTDITCVHGSDSLHDAITGELKPLPACHLFFCGIECDSISGLNGQADPGCIQAGRGKSGETASGCFEHTRKRRPLLWMVENARALSNMPGAKHGATRSANQGFALGTTGSVTGSANESSARRTTESPGHAQKSDLQHLLDLGNDLGYVVQAPTGVLPWARRPTAGLWAQ